MQIKCPKCGNNKPQLSQVRGPIYHVYCYHCSLQGIFTLVRLDTPVHEEMDYSERTGGHTEHGMDHEMKLIPLLTSEDLE